MLPQSERAGLSDAFAFRRDSARTFLFKRIEATVSDESIGSGTKFLTRHDLGQSLVDVARVDAGRSEVVTGKDAL